MSLPSFNFLHLMISKIQPGQIFSYIFRFPRYSPDKIFKLKVTTPRPKVKSRSHYEVAHLHPPTNVPTKFRLPTPYDSKIQPGRIFSGRPTVSPPTHLDTMGENNTPTALKGCGVKTTISKSFEVCHPFLSIHFGLMLMK